MIKSCTVQISKSHHLFSWADSLCKISAQIYNRTLYLWKRNFEQTGSSISISELRQRLKVEHVDYENPQSGLLYQSFGNSQLSNKTFELSMQVISSYFESLKSWKLDSSNFTGRPCKPHYKNRENGRFRVQFYMCYNSDGGLNMSNTFNISKKNGDIVFRGKNSLHFSVPDFLKGKTIKTIDVVPCGSIYKLVFNYESPIKSHNPDFTKFASIDLGVNSLITLSSNNSAKTDPFVLIDGKKIKSINQGWNRKVGKLGSKLPKGKKTSKKIQSITIKRNNQIKHEIQISCKFVIQNLIRQNISTLIVGSNPGWKQGVNLGKKNNQKFVQIPFDYIKQNLKWRCEENGIAFVLQEESYTSKASFLDLDKIPVHGKEKGTVEFSGKRIHRGLYQSKNGRIINADINGSLNILRKCKDKAFTNAESVEVYATKPVLKLNRNQIESFFQNSENQKVKHEETSINRN